MVMMMTQMKEGTSSGLLPTPAIQHQHPTTPCNSTSNSLNSASNSSRCNATSDRTLSILQAAALMPESPQTGTARTTPPASQPQSKPRKPTPTRISHPPAAPGQQQSSQPFPVPFQPNDQPSHCYGKQRSHSRQQTNPQQQASPMFHLLPLHRSRQHPKLHTSVLRTSIITHEQQCSRPQQQEQTRNLRNSL